jgi:two-component system phosphate regulon sensor histidine kinase PhoR
MNLPIHRKWIVFLAILLFLSLSIQGYLVQSFRKPILFTVLIGFVVLFILTSMISRFLTGPINRMTGIARHLAPGHFERRDLPFHRDELETLAKAIEEIGFELKKKIEEVSKDRDYLQTILKGMVEGVLVVDGRGRILMANDALRNLLSLPSTIMERTPLEILRNAAMEGAIQQVLRDGGRATLELETVTAPKKALQVNVVAISSSPQGTGGAEPRGAVAVFHDMTRLKELEKVRQDFVANVSHELRTPLTTIKGYAETLLEGALKEDVASRFVQVINRHADRLTKIVEDLLTLSRIESRGFRLERKDFSLSELISDAVDFVKELADQKEISITSSGVPASFLIHGDRSHLEQVFINLLDNAIKYGRKGGTITASAAEKPSGEVQVSVRDNGIGIPEEDLPRIFERFYRVDKGRSTELGGTGLGLSIVKHIVQAHGGSVWAESRLGEGSTFYFTLPKKNSY